MSGVAQQAQLQLQPDVAGYYRAAQQKLPPALWHYLEHGAGQEHSLQRNLQAFATASLMPRPLAQVAGGHTHLSLCGQAFSLPLLMAPLAYQTLFHADGENATAQAAAAQDVCMLVSSLSSVDFASIAASGVHWWLQLYWQGSRSASLELLQRAQQAGCSGVVLTVDAPVKQAQLQLPPQVRAVNLRPKPEPQLAPQQCQVFDGWMTQAPDWEDVAWLRRQCAQPLLLKGILHADDAHQAQAMGIDGLVISNHGGRVLDGAPCPLDLMPALRRTLGPDYPLLLDSGIRSGHDVAKALVAGADAVLLGRPYVWALASAGALGVAHLLRLLRDEYTMCQALCGAASPRALRG